MKSGLPIDQVLPVLLKTLNQQSTAILVASPGAGKTTIVPPALLDAPWLEGRKIIMLEPRRMAARAAARRMAALHQSPLGETFGYHVRFDRRTGPKTRVEVLTEGLLTRRLQNDPFLEDVGMIIFDEFHERSIHADLALALTREVQATVRPNLRLLIMSATLAGETLGNALGDVPVIEAAGFLHPVNILHLERPSQMPLPQRTAQAVERFLRAEQHGGDLLVFLPGEGEIYRTMELLQAVPAARSCIILPLHGSLPPEQQDRALQPLPGRKIILATNIAETSLTIEGVTIVIDSGYSRQIRLDPTIGLERLELERISLANATQRAGRAGRLQSGTVLRLWTKEEETLMAPELSPEILRLDLTPLVLELAAWGKPDPATCLWLTPPPKSAVSAAQELLKRLEAFDTQGTITPLGRKMAEIPAHPRLARILLEAAATGLVREGADLAALLSERDLLSPSHRKQVPVGKSDILHRLDLLKNARDRQFRGGSEEADSRTARSIARLAEQFLELTRSLSKTPVRKTPATDDDLCRLLLAGFPDRVARRRQRPSPGTPAGFVLVGGRGLRLDPASSVQQSEFVLALVADGAAHGETREGIIRQASHVEPEWIEEFFPHSCHQERTAWFDPQRKAVGLRLRKLYLGLPLSEKQAPPREEDRADLESLLATHAAENLSGAFEIGPSLEQLKYRLALLKTHEPRIPTPEVQEGWIIEHLPELVSGKRSFSELREIDLAEFITDHLDFSVAQALRQLVPERLTFPSGRKGKITYQLEGPPILAVKLQELFGQTETPCLVRGRVPVLIHLLSPAGRPLQITQDLKSFWLNTYPSFRKEMRARYPRHSWPENPLATE